MKLHFTNLKDSVFSKIIMPKEFKSARIERNLKKVFIITPILLVFSGLNLVYKIYCYVNDLPMEDFAIEYYGIFFLTSLISLILAFIFHNKKNINSMVKNTPLFVLFTGFMIICYLIFMYGPFPFNSLMVFVCTVVLIPLLFAMEPIVYNTVLIIVFAAIAGRLKSIFGMGGMMDVLILVIILNVFSFQKWILLVKQIKHEQETIAYETRLEQELEMASTVQKSFYEHNLDNVKDWEIAYCNDPMLSLSGDLFDFYSRKDTLTGLSIFDVSGHGLSAGLVTMLVKDTMEDEFYDNEDYELEFTMQRINEVICAKKGNIENYLTGIMLRFKNEKIEMVNAGHPVPIIYSAQKNQCSYMESELELRQGAIGLMGIDYEFHSVEFDLQKGDEIILYTDGVIEAKNSVLDEYGKERFLQSVQSHCELSVQQQKEEILKDIKNFTGTSSRTDDISLIILKKM